MATAKDPLARARDIKRCQLCPGKYRKSAAELVCNTCHVSLCKDCNGHHIALNPSIRHDVDTVISTKLDVIPRQHKWYKEEKCETLSEQSDTPVSFISGSHETHQLSNMSETHSSKEQQMDWYTDEQEKDIATDELFELIRMFLLAMCFCFVLLYMLIS
jgi:hypothetical protein